MSPNQVISLENGALSPIAERVLKVPGLTYEYGTDGIVIAHKAEMVVRTSALHASPSFRTALQEVAEPVGTLADIKGPPTELARDPRLIVGRARPRRTREGA